MILHWLCPEKSIAMPGEPHRSPNATGDAGDSFPCVAVPQGRSQMAGSQKMENHMEPNIEPNIEPYRNHNIEPLYGTI